MINNVSSSPFINFSSSVKATTASTFGNTNPAYKTDGFTPTANYSALSNGTTSYPISQIIYEDPALASRFGKFFMGTSDTLLRVGTNWFGKFLVNMVAGNIPLFTSKTVSTQISNNVNLWIGRSDLVRVGATPYQATLLQDVGVKNVNDLSIITNPSDQAVISQMMMAAAATRGQPVMIDPITVSGWVATAQQLPKYF